METVIMTVGLTKGLMVRKVQEIMGPALVTRMQARAQATAR